MSVNGGDERPAAIFDLDGTLVDSAFGIAAALNATGLAPQDVAVETVRGLVSFGAEQLIQESLGLAEAEVPRGLAAFREIYAQAPCAAADLYPGADAALRALRHRGVGLAVCTNKPQALAELVLERLNLSTLFDAVIGAAPRRRPSKPDPAPLKEAVARLKAGPAVLIGDSMVDALTARAAGLPFVHVSFGYGLIEAGVDCAGVADNFLELLPVLEPLLWPASLPSAR